jgi:PAS domain S-box-containing protein
MSGNPLPNHANKPGLPAGQGEKLYQALFYGSPEPIIIYDRNAVILALNPVAAENLGASIEACIGRSLQEFVPEMYDLVRQRIAQVITTGKTLRVEDWVDLHDGRRCFASTLQLIRDFHNGEDAVQAIAYEITAQRQAEAAKQQSDQLFQNLADNLPGAIFKYVLYPDGSDRVTYMSFGCERLWEVKPEQVAENATILWEMVLLEDLPKMQESVIESAQTLQEWNHEWRIITPSGKLKWIQGKGKPQRRDNGDVVWYTVILDITDRKQAELSLAESEARYRRLYEDSPVMMHSIDRDGRLINISNHWLKKLGYEREEIIGRRSIEFLTEDSRRYAEEIILPEYFRTGKVENVPYQFVCKDGKVIDILASAIAERDEHGNFVRFLGVFNDITEQKQAEAERDRFFELSIDILGIAGFDGFFKRINPAFERMLGYTQAELLALPFIELVHPDDREATIAIYEALIAGEIVVAFENRYRHQDGSYRWLQWNAIAALESQVIYAAARDITEQKQAEETLRRAYADVESQVKHRTVQLRVTNKLLQQEINQHIAAEAALRRVEEIQRIILSAIPDLLVLVDSEGNHLNVMSGGEVLLTKNWEETCRSNVYAVLPPHLAEQRMQFIKLAIETGEKQVYEYEIEIKGKTYYEEARIVVSGENEALVIVRDISDRKRVEQELADSYMFLQSIIDYLPVSVFVKDGREETFGQLILLNKTCEQLFGKPASQLLGKTGFEFFPAEHVEFYKQKDREAFEQGEAIDIPEELIDSPTLGKRMVHTVKVPLFDHEGRPQYLICCSEDITERKAAETALRRVEEIQRIILSAIPDLLVRVDREGNYLNIMSGGEITLINEREVFQQSNLKKILPPHLAEQRLQFINLAIETGEKQVYEYEIEVKGKTYYEEARIVVSGENEVLTIVRDITDRKAAEDALRESEERYRLLSVLSPVGIWKSDLKGLNTYANERAAQLVGRKLDQVAGQGWTENILPSDRDRVFCEWQNFLEQAQTQPEAEFQSEICFVHADNSTVWTLVRAVAERNANGEVIGFIGSVTDISDRKAAEQALWENSSFLETIMHNLPVSLFVKDGREENFGKFIFINQVCEQMLGLSAAEMIGKNDYDFFPPEQADFYILKDRQTYANKTLVDIPEEPIDSATLGRRILHTIKVPLFDKSGNPRYLIGFAEDITDRKAAEDALRANLKREKELNQLKSKFVSITSHEFRNPLATINAATQNLINYSHKLSDQSKQKRLQNIKKACDQMDKLLDEVLVLARLESGSFTYNPDFLDFDDFCHELITEFDLVSQQKSIAIDLQLIGNCKRLWLDQKLISLALHNLLSNAIKFSPEQSTVTFTVIRDSEFVSVAIADQGIGIPATEIEKLFKSFQRASNAGAIEGTGLGLSIAKQVIDLCGGTIGISSEVDQGTTFTIKLPCVPGVRL